MIAVTAPGQGAQRPGGLLPWLEQPGVAAHLRRLSDAADLDLVSIGTTADADTIRDTANAQPLIVATGLVTARRLDLDPDTTVWAGHSVGELTAAALSGVVSEEDAVHLAAVRGRAMARASALEPTGMAAVLGGRREEVLAALAAHDLTAANVNATDQVVASGRTHDLDHLRDASPAGSRVIALRVAGAFHSPFMAPAQEAFESALAAVDLGPVRGRLLSNADGRDVTSSQDVVRRLAHQLCAPVRWDLTMQTIVAAGVDRLVELAPAGTLTALTRREHPDLEAVALRSPADLPHVAAAGPQTRRTHHA